MWYIFHVYSVFKKVFHKLTYLDLNLGSSMNFPYKVVNLTSISQEETKQNDPLCPYHVEEIRFMDLYFDTNFKVTRSLFTASLNHSFYAILEDTRRPSF